MILHIVKCEMCENQFPFGEETPLTWFTVFRGNLEGQVARHYCSDECLQDWLNQRLTVNDLSPKLKVDHEPYPYCCQKHYPMPDRTRGRSKE